MDYKRNKNIFSKTYSKNLVILAVCGALLIVAMAFVWRFLYEFIPDLVSEALMVVGAAMIIASISLKPKDKYLTEQIEELIPTFRADTADKLKLPSDFDDNSLTLWGYIDGHFEKMTKSGMRLTDRVQLTVLYIKRNELYIRTQKVCLSADESSIDDYSLPLDTLTLTLSQDEKLLTLSSGGEIVDVAIVQNDYNLEQYIEKIKHKQR